MLLQMAGFHSFFVAEYYSIVHRHHIFFIHSSTNGHVGCFHNLAIINNVAIGVRNPFELVFLCSLGKYLVVQFLDHRVFLVLIFGGTPTLFSTGAEPICFPTNMPKGPLFSIFSPTLVISLSFYTSYSDWCEVISHCGFDLHFPDDEVMLSIFSCICWPSVCLLWRNVYSGLLPF